MKLHRLFQLIILTALLFEPIGNSGHVHADTSQEPSVITSIAPSSVNVGETALVNVNLNHVPSEGYSGAEFTCTYNANSVEAGNIVVTQLFGTNAITVINGPQNGNFILAIAANKGNKATTSGTAFTFSLKGLQAGQIGVECTARIPTTDKKGLLILPSTGAILKITGNVSTPTPNTIPLINSPTPSVTPGDPTATSTPSVAFDFVANACSAIWLNETNELPCPGIDGDADGFVNILDHPLPETGSIDTRRGLLMVPQNIHNGIIQGIYPPFRVQSGDRFRATIGCEGGATDCYVVYRLDYATPGSSQINTFWAFVERYDGFPYNANIDLNIFAGQDIRFILTILSNGSSTGDRALWIFPIIQRSNMGPAMIGQVLAEKAITVSLYRADNSLAASASANSEGNFMITAPPGTYSVIATSSGSLSAQGSITIPSAGTSTMQTVIDLPTGDIDNNNIIDKFDALTIGMNYNGAVPAVADLNNDGVINVLDLELLAHNYQKSGPLLWQ